MTFFFRRKRKENDNKDSKKDLEEVKSLKVNLNKLIEENRNLKNHLDDQKETTLQNQKLLESYIFSITTQEELVEKMNTNISSLQSKTNAQALTIKQLK